MVHAQHPHQIVRDAGHCDRRQRQRAQKQHRYFICSDAFAEDVNVGLVEHEGRARAVSRFVVSLLMAHAACGLEERPNVLDSETSDEIFTRNGGG